MKNSTPKKLTGSVRFWRGAWQLKRAPNGPQPVAHLSFYLGQHFGNPYFKWTDLVVKIDHQKRGSPKKNTCATKTAKNQERRRLFVLRKKNWFHQSWIHPKIIQAWHHSYINFSHSVFCLQISILFVYPVSIHLPIIWLKSHIMTYPRHISTISNSHPRSSHGTLLPFSGFRPALKLRNSSCHLSS